MLCLRKQLLIVMGGEPIFAIVKALARQLFLLRGLRHLVEVALVAVARVVRFQRLCRSGSGFGQHLVILLLRGFNRVEGYK